MVKNQDKTVLVVVALLLSMLLPERADAFRCKSRVIRDGMHEAEVVRLCGEPVAVKHLGFVIRSYGRERRRGIVIDRRYPAGYGHYQREVQVVEMLFNFGPRRLMRQVRFEGGLVASIRTMGYGYIEN